MKSLKSYMTLLAIFFMALAGCSEESPSGPVSGADAVRLRMLVNTPGAGESGTRAVAESVVEEVTVMVLENEGTDYTYQYAVQGYSLTTAAGSEDYDYGFYARLIPTANPVRLLIIANGGAAINAASPGMTEQQVKEAVTMAFTSTGFTDVLPMTGIAAVTQGLSADLTVDNVTLLRSAARVDVVNSAANFTLNSVRIYRATDNVQLIPDQTTGNAVTTPSVPAGAARSVDTPVFSVTNDGITEQIYIPESESPPTGDRRLTATAVVVGGFFDGSATETFYRMDFDPDDDQGQLLFGQVLRNHLYRFDIAQVLAPGWPTDDEASVNPSTSIEVAIQVWDEITMEMVFDNYDHFGVSRRSVRLGYAAGSQESIYVDTSLETYSAYWGDADGNITDPTVYITPGGDFDDPGGLYNAAISSDGTVISFTSLAPYDPATAQTRYLVIVAGRLRIVLSVTQGTASYGNGAVSIFNSTNGIGSFGNYVTGGGWNPIPGERAYGIGNMLMGSQAYGPQNFGPGRTVDMQGIYILGVPLDNTMPRNYYQGSDVLYLTYNNSPTAAQAESILDWLAEDDHRVLIVQFDDTNPANTAGTNYTVMARLGLNRIAGSPTSPYDYAGAAAPDFVRTGPFGTLPDSFTYKCRDDTYGGISPAAASAAGFVPLLLTGSGSDTPGNYLLSVDPQRRIILCGDCDLWSNVNGGSSGYYLNLSATSAANLTVDPDNPAQVMIGNLWAWIVDVVLRQDQ